MSATTAVAPQSPEQAPLSEGARIVNTFVAPTKTFNDINSKASWFVPWLLLALMPVVVGYTVGQKVGWQQSQENQLRISPKQAERVEKQRAQATPQQRAMGEKVGNAISAGITYGWGIMRLIGYVIVALVLW